MGRDRTRIERLEQLQDSSSLVNVTGTPPIVVTTPSPSVRNVSVTGLSGNNTGDQTIILIGDVTGSGTGQFATILAAGQRRYTGTAAGTNTYTVTTTPTHTAYAAGDRLTILFTNGNTGASTINDNSLGAKAIQLKGAALIAGDIPAGSTLDLQYDGTNFQIVGSSGNFARYTVSSTSGTNTITGTASPTPSSYSAGDLYIITFTNANTGAATLNANSLGAKAIQFKQAALTGGEIAAASTMALEYDGTQFQLVGSGGGGTTSPLTTKGDIYTYSTTNDRLPVGTNNYILTPDSTASTGLKWQTLSAQLDAVFGSTRGMILRREASSWAAYALGTSGQALVSDGTDAKWGSVGSASSGGLILLESVANVSAASTLSFTSTLDLATDLRYRIEWEFKNATGGDANILLVMNSDTTTSHYFRQSFNAEGSTIAGAGANANLAVYVPTGDNACGFIDVMRFPDGNPCARTWGIKVPTAMNAGATITDLVIVKTNSNANLTSLGFSSNNNFTGTARLYKYHN